MKFLIDFIMPPTKNSKGKQQHSRGHQQQKQHTSNVQNNNFFLQQPASTSADDVHFDCHIYPQKVLNNLNALRLDQRFCDVQIRAGQKIFNVHRAILSASSPYFHAMFTGGLSEKDQSSVELHAITPDILESLINFIYTGSILVNQNSVQELMVAADMLELVDVVNECTQFFIKEIHPFNAIGIYRFSETHNFLKLKSIATDFIEANFTLICESEEFYDLDKEELTKFLSSEYLRVDTEFQVFQAAISWIRYDIVQRRRFVFEILKHVRLALMSLGLLERAVTNCEDSSLRVALKSVHNDLVLRKDSLVPLGVSPRLFSKRDIFLIGGCKREATRLGTNRENNFPTVQRYDLFKGEWQVGPNMSTHRLVPGVAVFNNAIYVVGGELDSVVLNSVERYTKDENNWCTVAPMNVPRCEFGLYALDGYLYAVGGWIEGGIGASIERYDPVADNWHLIDDLPEPRFSMGLVSYQGKLYMVGGCLEENRYINDLISYDPTTKKIVHLAKMSVPRSQMGVAVVDDYLYVVGGEDRHEVLNSSERYSFKQNKWTMLTPMMEARCRPAVAAFDGRLYVCGGTTIEFLDFFRTQVTLPAFEVYDIMQKSWTQYPALPESRGEAGAVVL